MTSDRQTASLPLTLLLLTAGLALRLWFLLHANPLQGDPLLYANIARNLLQHGVYSFVGPGAPLSPTLIRLPGYPLFLALCFQLFGINNFFAVELLQAAIDLLSCLLLSRLAGTLFGRRSAFAVLALGALCPFTANYTATPLTETLTLFTITLAFVALFHSAKLPPGRSRTLWLAVLPFTLAFSLLLRPEQGLLAVVILASLALFRLIHAPPARRLRTALPVPVLLGVLTLLPLIPWTARNWHTFHVVQPLAPHYATDPGEAVPLGFQRWFRSWAVDFASTEEVYWNYDGSPILLTDLPARAFDSPAQRATTARLLDDYNQTTQPTAAFDARFQALADARRRASPARYFVWLPLARLANMLLRPRTELMNTQLAWWRWREAQGQTVFALSYAALNLAWLALGIAGLTLGLRRLGGPARLLFGAMLAFALLRCALLLTLDNSEPRYTLELFPLLILWAGALFAPPRLAAVSSSSARSS